MKKEMHVLRIYLSEDKRIEGKPAYEWIIRKARVSGLAGGVVTRGILGYGRSNMVHSSKIISLSEELPLTVEIVEEPGKVDDFAATVRKKLAGGVVTVTEVSVFE